MQELPYLTNDIPGIGGRIKEHVDDFRVEELPLYDLSGKGTHLYIRLTKSGIPTPVAVNRVARHLGVHPSDVGVAGLKDSQAVTSQFISVEYADPKRVANFHDSQMKLEPIAFHGNKLRPGLLAGNRFSIRIRGVNRDSKVRAETVLGILHRRGCPNYFGEQRFGSRGDTGLLGEMMVKNDLRSFVQIFLGRSMPTDPPDCKAARDAFDTGFYDRAIKRWPRHYVDQRRALIAFKRRENPVASLAAIDKRMKRLFVSAFQSDIFNEVLTRRLNELDSVRLGDLAQKVDTEGIFLVEDLALDVPRAEKFDISATGPIVGFRSNLAQGEPGAIEQEVLNSHGVTQEDFRRVGVLKVRGSRRPLRFRLIDPLVKAGRDARGDYLELGFSAPSGCYATVALREIMKSKAALVEPQEEESEESAAEE